MCAMFSTSVLVLTWWPLLRDCTFYSVSLISLVLFFTDQQITWYESATLLGIYGSYGFFMKFNAKAEMLFKKMIGASNKVQDSVSDIFFFLCLKVVVVRLYRKYDNMKVYPKMAASTTNPIQL